MYAYVITGLTEGKELKVIAVAVRDKGLADAEVEKVTRDTDNGVTVSAALRILGFQVLDISGEFHYSGDSVVFFKPGELD